MSSEKNALSFPVKLGIFAKKQIFAPDTFPGTERIFGYVTSSLSMPHDGAGYIVEFDPENARMVRILAYIDLYGRTFSCAEEQVIPPTAYPDLQLVYDDDDAEEGDIEISLKGGTSTYVARFDCTNGDDIAKGKFWIDSISIAPSCELNLTRKNKYLEFLTLCHIAWCVLDATENAMQPFYLGETIKRLLKGNFFAAINHEMLEATDRYDANPKSRRGIEEFFVRELQDSGIVGKTNHDFTLNMSSFFEESTADAYVDGTGIPNWVMEQTESTKRPTPSIDARACTEESDTEAEATAEAHPAEASTVTEKEESLSASAAIADTNDHAGKEEPISIEGKEASDDGDVEDESPELIHIDAQLLKTEDYADTFYLLFSYSHDGKTFEDGQFASNAASKDQRVQLLKAEAALNRLLLLTRYLEKENPNLTQSYQDCVYFDGMMRNWICLEAPEPDEWNAHEDRWCTHENFARSCENMALPYRLTYDYATNAEGNHLAVHALAPSADVMPSVLFDEKEDAVKQCTQQDKNRMMADYAANLAFALAACAFASSSFVGSACVNIMADDAPRKTLLSVQFERKAFRKAFIKAERSMFADPFATLDGFNATYKISEEGSLLPIEPTFFLDKGQFAGSLPDLVHECNQELPPAMQKALNITQVSELNIFEGAERNVAAKRVLAALDAGVDKAWAELERIYAETSNQQVRTICQDLLNGFDLGGLDGQSFLEIKEAFNDPYGFKKDMLHGISLANDDEPEAAITVLENLASRMDAMTQFQDTETECHRFFSSYEERILFALLQDDGTVNRKVKPLPDDMFAVHEILSTLYANVFMDAEKSLHHAKRCIEIAPAHPQSYLRAARAYWIDDDFEREIKMCCKALELETSKKDAGLAYYWLGFALCGVRKYNAAAICYAFAIQSECEMAGMAMRELNELKENIKGLRYFSDVEEFEQLEKEGVPVSALYENVEQIMEVAAGLVNSDAVMLGCMLAENCRPTENDDALHTIEVSLLHLVKDTGHKWDTPTEF